MYCDTLTLPKMDGVEISPGVWLIGEPTPVPGTNKLRCLAKVGPVLAIVELVLTFKQDGINDHTA